MRIQITSFFCGVLVGLCRLVACASLSAAAESEPPVESGKAESTAFDGAEEMIVSAAHTPRSRGSVPNFTTILEGKDLDTSVSTSLVDALRFVPGQQITQDGGRGGSSP